MGELSKLPNIGKTVEEQLSQVGISSVGELMKVGAKAAWLKIQEIDKSACINRLMALEGASSSFAARFSWNTCLSVYFSI
ncbi:MAG: TfoX/Sxy family DNA transformation protein [Peptococcaceae bacterium]|nr:TfoX/Sxy family DNA transformation protein [Peptococcaceae bacterium]